MVTLILAGCGGNGGGTTAMEPMEPTEPTTPTPPTCAEDPSQQRCVDQMNTAKAAQAAKLAPAIADPDGNGLFTGLQKDERPNLPAGTTYPLAVEGVSTGAGTKAEIKVSANDVLGVDDMKNGKSRPNQFQEMGKVAYLGNFDGQAYRGEDKNKAYDLTVYTDRKAAESVSYLNYYTSESNGARTPIAGRPGLDSNRAIDGNNFSNDDHADYGKLNVGLSTTDSDTVGALFDASWFPTGSGASRSIESGDTGDDRKFVGTFNGVNGTYECSTGECTAENDDDGKLDSLSGSWTFAPAKGVDIETVQIDAVGHDADYLAFGYWIETTTNRDDTTDLAVNTFATGSQPYFLSGGVSAATLQGKATYTGQAAGQYVLKTGPVGDAKPTDSGGFTGNASLTALFGGNSIALADHLSISGSITHLRNGAGEIIDPNWTVSLMKAAMSGGDARTTPLVFGTRTGTAINATNTNITNADAMTTGGGSWEGGFFGIPTPTTTTTEDYPTGVAGEFNAHFSNGHVIGAFGATKK